MSPDMQPNELPGNGTRAPVIVLPARTYADRVARCRQSLIDGIMLDAAAEWAAGRTVEGDELASIADGMARQWRLCVTFGPEVAS